MNRLFNSDNIKFNISLKAIWYFSYSVDFDSVSHFRCKVLITSRHLHRVWTKIRVLYVRTDNVSVLQTKYNVGYSKIYINHKQIGINQIDVTFFSIFVQFFHSCSSCSNGSFFTDSSTECTFLVLIACTFLIFLLHLHHLHRITCSVAQPWICSQ